jgi:phosphoribosylformylglycinamidine (FGAM) synthase PurS component
MSARANSSISDIEIEPGENVDTIAREVLINPVIEDYEIEYL